MTWPSSVFLYVVSVWQRLVLILSASQFVQPHLHMAGPPVLVLGQTVNYSSFPEMQTLSSRSSAGRGGEKPSSIKPLSCYLELRHLTYRVFFFGGGGWHRFIMVRVNITGLWMRSVWVEDKEKLGVEYVLMLWFQCIILHKCSFLNCIMHGAWNTVRSVCLYMNHYN